MWVLLGLLAAALLAVGVLVLPSLIGEDPAATPTVQVANVVGQLEAQATATLKAQNLNVTRVEATSAEVAEGRVVQTGHSAWWRDEVLERGGQLWGQAILDAADRLAAGAQLRGVSA